MATQHFLVESSAPGKAILFGEHAVVYGRKAIASALDLRTFVRLEATRHKEKKGDEDIVFELYRPDLREENQRRKNFTVNQMIELYDLLSPLSSADHLDIAFLDKLTTIVQDSNDLLSKEDSGLSAVIFLWMALWVFPHVNRRPLKGPRTSALRLLRSWTITISMASQLPCGAGLGSSAAMSVALVAAVTELKDQKDRTHSDFWDSDRLLLLNAWSLQSERILHGPGASGLDNSMATYGGSLTLQRTPSGSLSIDFWPKNPQIKVIVTNTGQPRNTRQLIAAVKAVRDAIPAAVDHVLDAIQEISETAQKILLSDDPDADPVAALAPLIRLNHKLLQSVNTGHDSIDHVTEFFDTERGWATKLTGAGGGGCVLTLPPSGVTVDTESLADLQRSLRERTGKYPFHCFSTLLGGKGVMTRSERLQSVPISLDNTQRPWRIHNSKETVELAIPNDLYEILSKSSEELAFRLAAELESISLS